jgi:hypothetical protein
VCYGRRVISNKLYFFFKLFFGSLKIALSSAKFFTHSAVKNILYISNYLDNLFEFSMSSSEHNDEHGAGEASSSAPKKLHSNSFINGLESLLSVVNGPATFFRSKSFL